MRLLVLLVCSALIISCETFDNLPDFPTYQGAQNNENNNLKPKSSNKTTRTSNSQKSVRVHYIDPYLVKRKESYNKAMKVANKKCQSKTLGIDFDCKMKHSKMFDKNVPNRGTAAYVAKHYAKLDKVNAIKKRNQLVEMLTKVHFVALPENKGIELTVDMVKREILHLEGNVLKITPNKY